MKSNVAIIVFTKAPKWLRRLTSDKLRTQNLKKNRMTTSTLSQMSLTRSDLVDFAHDLNAAKRQQQVAQTDRIGVPEQINNGNNDDMSICTFFSPSLSNIDSNWAKILRTMDEFESWVIRVCSISTRSFSVMVTSSENLLKIWGRKFVILKRVWIQVYCITLIILRLFLDLKSRLFVRKHDFENIQFYKKILAENCSWNSRNLSHRIMQKSLSSTEISLTPHIFEQFINSYKPCGVFTGVEHHESFGFSVRIANLLRIFT